MMKRQAGFTLVELLVVILVIGILAGLLLPQFAGVKNKATDTKCLSNVKNIATALESYAANNEVYPPGDEYNQADSAFCGAINVNEKMGQCPFDASGSTMHSYVSSTSNQYTLTCASGNTDADHRPFGGLPQAIDGVVGRYDGGGGGS